MEADTGKYVFSMDLGLQNVVTAIDPRTGAKMIDARLVPGDGETKFVVPARRRREVVAAVVVQPAHQDALRAAGRVVHGSDAGRAGGRGSLSTGVRWSLRPRPDSDGKYGRLQAINLETRRSYGSSGSARR